MSTRARTSPPLFARVCGLVLLPVALCAAASSAHAAPPSPKPWLKSVLDRGTKLAEQRVQPGTPAEEKWQGAAKALIDETLDWPGLTEAAYGKQWSKLSAADQQAFAQNLREMIEASYQSKLKLLVRGGVKKPAEVKVEWLDEKLEGDEATVNVRVKADKSVAVLQFRQRWHDGAWRVWDVSIDEVSTVRTYRTQFTKLVAKDGFPALLARMKTKVEEIRAGKSDLAAE